MYALSAQAKQQTSVKYINCLFNDGENVSHCRCFSAAPPNHLLAVVRFYCVYLPPPTFTHCITEAAQNIFAIYVFESPKASSANKRKIQSAAANESVFIQFATAIMRRRRFFEAHFPEPRKHCVATLFDRATPASRIWLVKWFCVHQIGIAQSVLFITSNMKWSQHARRRTIKQGNATSAKVIGDLNFSDALFGSLI